MIGFRVNTYPKFNGTMVMPSASVYARLTILHVATIASACRTDRPPHGRHASSCDAFPQPSAHNCAASFQSPSTQTFSAPQPTHRQHDQANRTREPWTDMSEDDDLLLKSRVSSRFSSSLTRPCPAPLRDLRKACRRDHIRRHRHTARPLSGIRHLPATTLLSHSHKEADL